MNRAHELISIMHYLNENLDSPEELKVFRITEDSEWSGMYEVFDASGLMIATAITPQMAMAGAVEELDYFADSVDEMICDVLHGGEDW